MTRFLHSRNKRALAVAMAVPATALAVLPAGNASAAPGGPGRVVVSSGNPVRLS
ncbi:MAG: hypothetical protein ACRC35_12435 [Angustibacter sp.]